MRARIDTTTLYTSVFSLDEQDALVWWFDGTSLLVQGEPGTISAAGFAYINMQVSRYDGPGNYRLAFAFDTNTVGLGFYGILAGIPPEPVASYQTLGENQGQLHISALDTTLGVITGTFEFAAERNDGGTGVVRVIDGSFRIRKRLT